MIASFRARCGIQRDAFALGIAAGRVFDGTRVIDGAPRRIEVGIPPQRAEIRMPWADWLTGLQIDARGILGTPGHVVDALFVNAAPPPPNP